MPSTTNNFFVYANNDWKQINPDFTEEITYLQELILVLNNKITKLTDEVESANDYDELQLKIMTIMRNKLKYYLNNLILPYDVYKLTKMVNIVLNYCNSDNVYSVYIDNVNGSDNNDGTSIFKPRKTIPPIDENANINGTHYSIRLLDSPIPYKLEDIAITPNSNYGGTWVHFSGNSQDPSKVQIIQNDTTQPISLTYLAASFNNCTFNSEANINTNWIGFYNVNLTEDINIDYAEGTGTSQTGVYATETDADKIIVTEDITLNTADMDGYNPSSYFPQVRTIQDFYPVPNNTNITNLDELKTYMNYLQNIFDTTDVNIIDLLENLPTPNPTITCESGLVKCQMDYIITHEFNESLYYMPLTAYKYDTNEEIGSLNNWYGLSKSINVSSVTAPANIKVTIGDLFELITEHTTAVTTNASTLRTALNNNKISGGAIGSNTAVNGSSYTGGIYQYTISTLDDYRFNIPRMRFNTSGTDTAEFRFGYDNTDTDPQHYLQLLIQKDKVIFNEVNDSTITHLTTYNLPSTVTNTTNVPFDLIVRSNGQIQINFNEELNYKIKTTALSHSTWYINIPSNSSGLIAIGQTGIVTYDYPEPVPDTSEEQMYTKSELDAILNTKANTATTYTKTEVDNLIGDITTYLGT